MLFKAFLIALFTSMVVADYYQQNADDTQPELLYGQQSARFLAFKVTKTLVVFTTVVTNTTVTPFCAVLATSVTGCRRRRRGIEKPIILSFDEEESFIAPSSIQAIETTPAVPLESLTNGFSGLESSNEPVEVDIIGLQNDCVGRRFGLVPSLVSSVASGVASGVASIFPGISGVSSLASSLASSLTSALNLTLRFTTKLTATVVSTSTVTGPAKNFTISNCTPTPFLYSVCAAPPGK